MTSLNSQTEHDFGALILLMEQVWTSNPNLHNFSVISMANTECRCKLKNTGDTAVPKKSTRQWHNLLTFL